MQPLQCAAVVVGPALAAAAGLGRWFVGVAVLLVCGNFQRRRQYWVTAAHRALPVCDCPALGMKSSTARSNVGSGVYGRFGWASTGGCHSAVQIVCGGGGYPVCGDVHRRRQHSATAAYRALPMCE